MMESRPWEKEMDLQRPKYLWKGLHFENATIKSTVKGTIELQAEKD